MKKIKTRLERSEKKKEEKERKGETSLSALLSGTLEPLVGHCRHLGNGALAIRILADIAWNVRQLKCGNNGDKQAEMNRKRRCEKDS